MPYQHPKPIPPQPPIFDGVTSRSSDFRNDGTSFSKAFKKSVDFPHLVLYNGYRDSIFDYVPAKESISVSSHNLGLSSSWIMFNQQILRLLGKI
jgi:hypothetical protein